MYSDDDGDKDDFEFDENDDEEVLFTELGKIQEVEELKINLNRKSILENLDIEDDESSSQYSGIKLIIIFK